MGERPPSGTRQPAIHGWTTGDWQPTGGKTHVFRPSPSQKRKSLGKEGRWGGGEAAFLQKGASSPSPISLNDAGQLDAAGDGADFAVHRGASDTDGFVDGGQDEILKHFHIAAFEGFGIDGDGHDVLLTGGDA